MAFKAARKELVGGDGPLTWEESRSRLKDDLMMDVDVDEGLECVGRGSGQAQSVSSSTEQRVRGVRAKGGSEGP